MIKWFGIMILATYFGFGDRASLWSTVSQSTYRSAHNFGKTSMNMHCLDMLQRHVRWIHQPDVRDEGTIHETHWQKLVEYFVIKFNEYHTHLFSPSDIICTYESISKWYGQVGHWINLGFLIYVTMDRKPENGAEIQNDACGWLGVMMWHRVVKSAMNEAYQ